MPKIDIGALETRVGSPNYPAPFRHVCAGRHKTALGNAVGLSQFGVNLTKLEPGAATALRHWHEQEDEFVYMLEGECVLIENGGEVTVEGRRLRRLQGECRQRPPLVTPNAEGAALLEVGSARRASARTIRDDLKFERDDGVVRVLHKSGEPY